MTLEEAEKIYANPKGHGKHELYGCLMVLNGQPMTLSKLQFLAIQDAHQRLGVPMIDVVNDNGLVK